MTAESDVDGRCQEARMLVEVWEVTVKLTEACEGTTTVQKQYWEIIVSLNVIVIIIIN